MVPAGYQITVKSEGFEITVCGDEGFVTQKFKELEEQYGGGKKQPNSTKTEISKSKKKVFRKEGKTKDKKEDSAFKTITEKSIDRSRYPTLVDDDPDLRKSLWVLHVCEKEQIPDRLTAPEIAKICTQKFRIRLSRQSAKQALDRATSQGLVNPVPISNKKVYYEIMEKGTKWIQESRNKKTQK